MKLDAGGLFGRLLVPAIVLQSVLIGGGYATGREIVQYGARFGPRGWVAVACIFLGFTAVAILTFEFARVQCAYDYKSFMEGLIGRGWPLFDVLFLVMATVVMAVMISAATSIANDVLGLPPTPVSAAVVAAVALLSFFGSAYIERFKVLGTAALYLAYAVFAVVVLGGAPEAPAAAGVGAAGGGEASLATVAGSGLLYVGYNLVVFPTVLFVLHRQETRRETVGAGVLSGALMTLPFVLTFLCVLAFHPSSEVLEAPVPWLVMLEAAGGEALVGVFAVVITWTLLETSVGLVHAVLERMDEALRTASAEEESGAGGGLSRLQRGMLGGAALLVAMLLSKVGIIALVAEGYRLLAYAFIVLFALPLLTVGVKRIRERGGGGR